MLIGELPEDATPSSEDGMIPYSEDGIHLSYMPLSELMSSLSSGVNGDGSLAPQSFPNGSIGYISEAYFSENKESWYLNPWPLLKHSAKTIDENLQKFGSEYVIFDYENKSSSWVYGEQSSNNNIGRGINLLSIDHLDLANSPVWLYDTNVDCGFIPNSGYSEKLRENYPFILMSYKQSVLQWEKQPYEAYGAHRFPSSHFDSVIKDKKIPMLAMISTSITPGESYLSTGKMEGPYWHKKPFDNESGDDQYIYDPGVGLHPSDQGGDIRISQPFIDIDAASIINKSELSKNTFYDSGELKHMHGSKSCEFINKYYTYYDHSALGELKPKMVYSIINNIADNINEDYYSSQTTNFKLELLDRYYVYGLGAGTLENAPELLHGDTYTGKYVPQVHNLCDHIIYESGKELWIFYNSVNTEDDSYSIFPNHGRILNPKLYSPTFYGYVMLNTPQAERGLEFIIDPEDADNVLFRPNMPTEYGLPKIWPYSSLMPGRSSNNRQNGDIYEVYGEENVYFYDDYSDDPDGYLRSWRDTENANPNYFAYGLKMEPFSSLLLSSEGTIAMCVPTRKKNLYPYNLQSSTPLTGNKLIDTDAYYSPSDMFQYSNSGMQIPMTLASAGVTAIEEIREYFKLGNCTLNDLLEIVGGELPVPTPADNEKVLVARRLSGSTAIWEAGKYPLKISGNVDSDSYGYDSGVKTPNNLSNIPIIMMGKGLRARVEDANSHPTIRVNPSDIDFIDYIYLKSKVDSSTNNPLFSITKEERDIYEEGAYVKTVSEYTFDTADLGPALNIQAGSGMQVTTSYNAETNKRSYILSCNGNNTNLNINPFASFRDNLHINSEEWTSLNVLGKAYGPSGWEYNVIPFYFTPNKTYYIDMSVAFEVPEDIAPGSFARIILSYVKNGSDEYIVDSDQGEVANISRSGNFDDIRLLIPGQRNVLRFSGLLYIGSSELNNNLYLNMYHNAGVPLGTNTFDTVDPTVGPVPNLKIKSALQYMQVYQTADVPNEP